MPHGVRLLTVACVCEQAVHRLDAQARAHRRLVADAIREMQLVATLREELCRRDTRPGDTTWVSEQGAGTAHEGKERLARHARLTKCE